MFARLLKKAEYSWSRIFIVSTNIDGARIIGVSLGVSKNGEDPDIWMDHGLHLREPYFPNHEPMCDRCEWLEGAPCYFVSGALVPDELKKYFFAGDFDPIHEWLETEGGIHEWLKTEGEF